MVLREKVRHKPSAVELRSILHCSPSLCPVSRWSPGPVGFQSQTLLLPVHTSSSPSAVQTPSCLAWSSVGLWKSFLPAILVPLVQFLSPSLSNLKKKKDFFVYVSGLNIFCVGFSVPLKKKSQLCHKANTALPSLFLITLNSWVCLSPVLRLQASLRGWMLQHHHPHPYTWCWLCVVNFLPLLLTWHFPT